MTLPHVVSARPRLDWKPRELLEHGESLAVSIRKRLCELHPRRKLSSTSASTDDAVALAELIQMLASFGKERPAEEAIVIAEQVERMLEMLRTEIDAILAS